MTRYDNDYAYADNQPDKPEAKPDGWHSVHPEVDQLWINGAHVGSVSWTRSQTTFFAIVLWTFPNRDRDDFSTKEAARTWVEEKLNYSPAL